MVRLLKLADLLAHIIPVYNVNRKDWSIFPHLHSLFIPLITSILEQSIVPSATEKVLLSI